MRLPLKSALLTLAAGLAAWAAFAGNAVARDFPVGPRENIIVFGDSITADGRYCQIMQDLIDQRFPERQIRVLSRGASGDTVRRSFGRIETDVVRWRPAWVLINLGVNDTGSFTTEEFIANYEALIQRLRRDTGARIGIISPIFPDNDNPRPRYEEYIKALGELARRQDCLYIPAYERFQRLRPTLPKGVKYAPDGIHPNPLGYWIFAETILEALGYPFLAKPVEPHLPVTRLTSFDAPEVAGLLGRRFTVELPQCLNITITAFEPPRTTVRRAAKPIVLDGKLDEWDLAAPVTVAGPENLCGGTVSWRQGAVTSGTFHTCYDEKGLYVAVVVKTPVVLNTPKAGIVTRDCIELMLDLRSAEERAAAKSTLYGQNRDAHVCQYILAPATSEVPQPEVVVGAGDKTMADGVVCASSLTNTGYILEILIPAKQFPSGTMTPGASYGCDLTIDDVNRFESWDDLTMLRWSGSQYSFFSTLEFGVLTLAPVP